MCPHTSWCAEILQIFPLLSWSLHCPCTMCPPCLLFLKENMRFLCFHFKYESHGHNFSHPNCCVAVTFDLCVCVREAKVSYFWPHFWPLNVKCRHYHQHTQQQGCCRWSCIGGRHQRDSHFSSFMCWLMQKKHSPPYLQPEWHKTEKSSYILYSEYWKRLKVCKETLFLRTPHPTVLESSFFSSEFSFLWNT